MKKSEAIEKMVAMKALVQITNDMYMVNLAGGRLEVMPLGIVVVFQGLVLTIAYSDMSDIYQFDGNMVVETVGENTTVYLQIDC